MLYEGNAHGSIGEEPALIWRKKVNHGEEISLRVDL
jgi:hypothetical protein